MTATKLVAIFGTGLVLAVAPLAVASAEPIGSSGATIGRAQPLYSGRSVGKKRRRAPGSFTNGRPDGANTGSRKQTPTGGNPGDGNHS